MIIVILALVIVGISIGFTMKRKRTSPILDGNGNDNHLMDSKYREIPFNDLKIGIRLGAGSSGAVHKGKSRNVTVAIKIIPFGTPETLASIRS